MEPDKEELVPMASEVWWRIGVVAAMLATGPAAMTSAAEVRVDDHRPLAAALAEIERVQGWVVTYEDPIYRYSGDITDVSASVERRGDAAEKPLMVPRKGAFLAQYDTTSAEQAVRKIVDAYNDSGNPGRFAVEVAGPERLHVIPVGAAGAGGKFANQTPLLNMHITPPAKAGTALEQIEAIVAQLTRRDLAQITIGVAPTQWLSQQPAVQGIEAGTARAALDRIAASLGAPLSWQLNYDTGLRWYVLNLHLTKPTTMNKN